MTAPYGVAAGPDGKIWFTDPTFRQIGRMATNGTIVAGDLLGTPGGEPADFITAGPDGDMWAGGAAHVFQIPTNATSTSEIVSDGSHGGGGITTGPDGRLWFTYTPDPVVAPNYLGAITTGGSAVDYQVGSTGSPQYISDTIARGSDGRIWLGYDDAIARMSISGVIGQGDVFPLPAPAASVPNELALGPDGNVWFTESVPAAVGKITPSGQITLFRTPTASSLPFGIAAGPDGRMWFAERDADKIGAIPTDATSSADITEYPIGGSNVGALNIAAGPDGRMWFNETNTGSLGAITTGVPTASFKLAVSVAGTGKGTVVSQPAGIDCGSDCQAQFSSGSQVSLTATPAAGSTFTGWSGGCSGTKTCHLTISSDQTVTARFISTPPPGCKLSSSGKIKLTHRHTNHKKRDPVTAGSLLVAVTCNRAASIRLTGRLADAPSESHGARKPRTKHFTLKTSGTIGANTAKTFTLKLPAAAFRDLRQHANQSITLTLVARSSQGTSTITITVTRLNI
jgi:streptogramin lyase